MSLLLYSISLKDLNINGKFCSQSQGDSMQNTAVIIFTLCIGSQLVWKQHWLCQWKSVIRNDVQEKSRTWEWLLRDFESRFSIKDIIWPYTHELTNTCTITYLFHPAFTSHHTHQCVTLGNTLARSCCIKADQIKLLIWFLFLQTATEVSRVIITPSAPLISLIPLFMHFIFHSLSSCYSL